MLAYFQSILGSIMTQQIAAALGSALVLILVDFLLGIFVAVKQGTFDFRKLPQFLQTGIIPYVGSLLLLALFAGTSQSLSVLFLACTAFVAAKFLADIKDKLGQIFTGIQFQSPIAVKAEATLLTAESPQPTTPESGPSKTS